MKKTSLRILSTLSLTIIFGGIVLLIGRKPTLAQVPIEKKPIIELKGNAQSNGALRPDKNTSISQPSDQDVDSKQQKEQYLQDIQKFTEQWYSTIAKPGWLHVILQYKEDYDDTSVLPDGRLSDKEYTMDEWYLLDDQGYQVEAVFIQNDANGATIQVSIFRDRTWYNLTYNIASPVPNDILPLKFVLDFGFPQEAARLLETIEKEETNLDGSGTTVYTIAEKYAFPIPIADYKAPVTANKTKAYYDRKSGALILLEQVFTLSNGEERIRSSVRIISVETWKEPPEEILKHLKAEVTE